jgi:hypothetical protein
MTNTHDEEAGERKEGGQRGASDEETDAMKKRPKAARRFDLRFGFL